jgi:uncharacterized phage-associated protein
MTRTDPTLRAMMTTVTAHDVAAFLLAKAGSHLAVSAIHRMAYYAQGWHLAWAGTPLFDEEIRIRNTGPVVHAFFAHSDGVTETAWPAGNAAVITGKTANIVAAILDTYGGMSGISLGEIAKKGAPCIMALSRKTEEDPEPVIDLAEMKAFFKALDDAPQTGSWTGIPTRRCGSCHDSARFCGRRACPDRSPLRVRIAAGRRLRRLALGVQLRR